MIENETQYRVTCEQLAKLKEAQGSLPFEPPEDVHLLLWKAHKDALDSQINQLETEIAQWQQQLLERGKKATIVSLDFTVKEAVALEQALSFLCEDASLEVEPELLKGYTSNADLPSAWEKVKAKLNNLAQVQQTLLQQAEPQCDLTSGELIALCRQQGISVSEFLGTPKLSRRDAISAYRNGDITEGQLADCLGVDRLEARRIVQDESEG